MNIIASIRDFIKKCPYLEDYLNSMKPKVNVDFLGEEAINYSIERVPANPVIQEYIDGSKKKQELFIFTSRESYGEDVFNNLENINFYENFATWINDKNDKKDFPILDNRNEVIKFEVVTNGYAFATDIDKAQYQIQLKLTYMERK